MTEEPGSYKGWFTDDVYLIHTKEFLNALSDIGPGRLEQMDKNGLDLQILSMTVPSGIEFDNKDGTVLAHDANDELYDTTKRYPTRFKGFAALNPFDIDGSIKELQRVVKLGFVGWKTHSNFGKNIFLDDKRFWPLLEAIEALDVPIYLHPTIPMMREYGKYGFSLAANSLGFQFDTALCLMRMMLGGVFDQFPKLTIALGHLGETMPFIMERLDGFSGIPDKMLPDKPKLKRLPSQVLKENVYISTSGRFYLPTLEYVLKSMGTDRVMLATDYPYEQIPHSMDYVLKSGLPKDTIERISYQNAERVFKIKE